MVLVTQVQSFSHHRLNDGRDDSHEISASSHQTTSSDQHQSTIDAHQQQEQPTAATDAVYQHHDSLEEEDGIVNPAAHQKTTEEDSTENDDDSVESGRVKRQTHQLTAEELELVRQFVRQHGVGSWELHDILAAQQPAQTVDGQHIFWDDASEEHHSREVKDLFGWNSWESVKDKRINIASVEDSIEDLRQFGRSAWDRIPSTFAF